MMSLWKSSYQKRSLMAGPAFASTLAHAAIIGAWVIGTLPAASMAVNSIANHIFYIPPPDKAPSRAGATETIRYVNVAEGFGIGAGPPAFEPKLPVGPIQQSPVAGAPKSADTASVTTPPGNSDKNQDSVFT